MTCNWLNNIFNNIYIHHNVEFVIFFITSSLLLLRLNYIKIFIVFMLLGLCLRSTAHATNYVLIVAGQSNAVGRVYLH